MSIPSEPSADRAQLRKVVSGGQTGVDRAALDAALSAGLAVGGWCPRGRRAEDGRIPDTYPLVETPDPVYRRRTEWNVRDSDATLVLCRGIPSGGTALTVDFARERKRPVFIADLDSALSGAEVQAWIRNQGISILNVAGPRESQCPGIYRDAREWLRRLFATQCPGRA